MRDLDARCKWGSWTRGVLEWTELGERKRYQCKDVGLGDGDICADHMERSGVDRRRDRLSETVSGWIWLWTEGSSRRGGDWKQMRVYSPCCKRSVCSG